MLSEDQTYQLVLNQPLSHSLSARQQEDWSGTGMCPGSAYNLWITCLNPQPSQGPACSPRCSMCTSVTPRETFHKWSLCRSLDCCPAHPPSLAPSPWWQCWCRWSPLSSPLPSLPPSPPWGEVSCLPAHLIQVCQETAGPVERQPCDLPWWAHTVHITPNCATEPWYSVIFSSSSPLRLCSPRTQPAHFKYLRWYFRQRHIVCTVNGHSNVNLSRKILPLFELTVSRGLADPLGCALMKVDSCQAGWRISPSAPGCHTGDDSLLPVLRA